RYAATKSWPRSATNSTALDAAFGALDSVRDDVLAQEKPLLAEWKSVGLTKLQPVGEQTLLAAFDAQAQKFKTDSYAKLRADIIKDKADEFELKMKAKSGMTQAHLDELINKIEEYYKCLSDHNGNDDGDNDADDKSCIPGPDNDHDQKPPDPKHPKKPPPFPPQKFFPLLWPLPPFPQYPKGAFDPNDIVGPQGYGDQHFVPANQPLDYTIDFQNDASATAPAQQVVITDKLDPNIDPRSFRLGDFGFSGQRFSPPANSAFYQTTIDETAKLGIDIQVTASIDVLTDTAAWVFQAIDPATGEAPTDPSVGFLPPDDAFGAGEGFVSYTVLPNATVKTGDVINAQATVVFDTNPPIDTKQIFNTIDTGGSLGSQVLALPANEGTPQFTVSWAPAGESAQASAVASYDVYMSDNGGPFTPFVTDTTSTSATFNGQNDHKYQFYSLATDNAGNTQNPASATTVTTTVGDVVENPLAVTISPTEGASFSGAVATFTGSDLSGTASDFSASIVWGDGTTTTLAAISGTAAAGYTISGSHTYADDGTAVPLAIIVSDQIGNQTTIANPTDVADADILAAVGAVTISAAEGTTFSSTALATFTNTYTGNTASDFTATIDWGDGTS
ncbi:MAG TPA: hypothetical protein PK867_30185, partial [Pirellulales bacterium]|nr:hypothetical protein [Pirellulales bacterium]